MKSFPERYPQEKRDAIWRLVENTSLSQKEIAEQEDVSVNTVRAVEREHGFIRRPQTAKVTHIPGKFDLDTIEGAEAAVKHYSALKEQAERALRNALQSTMDMVASKLATLNTEDTKADEVILG